MKGKTLLLLLIFAVAMVIFMTAGNQVHAKMAAGISCSTCHTMHNSQNGAAAAMGSGRDAGGAGASERSAASPECATCHAALRPGGLLKMDCIGCHAENPNGPNNISPTTTAPQVAHSSGTDLAGGKFNYVFGGNDSKGHNVHGFSNISYDMNMIPPDMPPGYDGSLDYGNWELNKNDVALPLMCAGTNGCHGDRREKVPLKAMKSAHHTDDSVLKFTGQGGPLNQGGQGGTVGLSYRFLWGVMGGEDSDWEATFSATDHNEYSGKLWTDRDAYSPVGGVQITISALCSQCHGAFHASGPSGIGTGSSPWVRHPTDVGMAVGGEFSSYTYGNTSALSVPVARVTLHDPSDNNQSSSTSDRIVMCLTCHRAHATASDDSLRWTYDATMASPNGCYRCHSNK